jgi:hypothetical protein
MHKIGKYYESSGNIVVKLALEYKLTENLEKEYSAKFDVYRNVGAGIVKENPGRFKLRRKSKSLEGIFSNVIKSGPHLEGISDIQKRDIIECFEYIKKKVNQTLSE